MDEFVINWHLKHGGLFVALCYGTTNFLATFLASPSYPSPRRGTVLHCFHKRFILTLQHRIELIVNDTLNNLLYIFIGGGCVLQFSPFGVP
jgi:hypothetical protein